MSPANMSLPKMKNILEIYFQMKMNTLEFLNYLYF